ncbi:MAG: LarC family nickel insertion protein, partial [Lachnospiraceae bacterium]|nr:LarC family nickel insertion protein [Lachnospiraceae bacterium]
MRAGNLTENATNLAIHIFEILARAEAHVHGKSIDEVHFHEVGAVDSIVDIVAAAVCLDNLHPKEIVVSSLTEGHGQIRCQHGLIPIPVPAVSAIAVQEGLIMKFSDVEGELVTPTGAAIAAAIRTRDALPEEFRIRRVGIGAGKRDYATAGVLRAMWIEDSKHAIQANNNKELRHTVHSVNPDRTDLFAAIARTEGFEQTGSPESTTGIDDSASAGSSESMTYIDNSEQTGSPESMTCMEAPGQVDSPEKAAYRKCTEKTVSAGDSDKDSILVLETNIDDCTGESLAFTMQRLLSAGALDVFYIPIYMKKNRPAYLLKTICKPGDREALEAIIFQNTTTIGIRRQSMQLTKLSWEIIQMQTSGGLEDIKCCRFE